MRRCRGSAGSGEASPLSGRGSGGPDGWGSGTGRGSEGSGTACCCADRAGIPETRPCCREPLSCLWSNGGKPGKITEHTVRGNISCGQIIQSNGH